MHDELKVRGVYKASDGSAVTLDTFYSGGYGTFFDEWENPDVDVHYSVQKAELESVVGFEIAHGDVFTFYIDWVPNSDAGKFDSFGTGYYSETMQRSYVNMLVLSTQQSREL